jgi:hypothetical protein
MNARIPTKSRMQEMYDELKATYEKELDRINQEYQKKVDEAFEQAINLCIVTRMQADIDSGLAESTVLKTTKRWRSYIDSVHSGNVSLEEIKTTLKEEHGMKFEWMDK